MAPNPEKSPGARGADHKPLIAQWKLGISMQLV